MEINPYESPQPVESDFLESPERADPAVWLEYAGIFSFLFLCVVLWPVTWACLLGTRFYFTSGPERKVSLIVLGVPALIGTIVTLGAWRLFL